MYTPRRAVPPDRGVGGVETHRCSPRLRGERDTIARAVFDFVLRPVRAVLRSAGQEVVQPLEDTERETLGAVKAVDRATESIEHHVEVIETLATSVGPLTASVDRLTDTMQDLVKLLAPMAEAERGVAHVEHGITRAEHFLGFHRHEDVEAPEAPADHPET